MAIADYDSLVAAIKSYAARSDSTFSARIPDFVALAELWPALPEGGRKLLRQTAEALAGKLPAKRKRRR